MQFGVSTTKEIRTTSELKNIAHYYLTLRKGKHFRHKIQSNDVLYVVIS